MTSRPFPPPLSSFFFITRRAHVFWPALASFWPSLTSAPTLQSTCSNRITAGAPASVPQGHSAGNLCAFTASKAQRRPPRKAQAKNNSNLSLFLSYSLTRSPCTFILRIRNNLRVILALWLEEAFTAVRETVGSRARSILYILPNSAASFPSDIQFVLSE
jgi:hypothetical protein